ncbi:39kDa subunit of ndufa9, NADH:ubiquinone oxidoreductase [Tyrophagus putrescentiae]|nr:39kDa subunit of ndufa9, NADH:ubiquinone oxidoreductase [Tyrophagus putrescentiae]
MMLLRGSTAATAASVVLKGQPSSSSSSLALHHLRSLSTLPAERKADFAPRVVSHNAFPDVTVQKLRRGTGGRSSYSGLTVTVFGATGYLARAVVNGLAKTGTQVICPYRGDPYMTRELKLAGDLGQILFVPFSLRDTDTVKRAMKHSNVVINLIGRDNSTANFDLESIHVEGARTIARIAREMPNVKRLIHVSALNSSPNPEPHFISGGSNFLKTKYYGELAVREEFPEATIIRPAWMYGVVDRFLWYYCQFYRRSFRKLAVPNGGYGITKTPVCMTDVAAGIVNAISDEESVGRTYDAVGPRRYELRELLEFMQELINKVPENGGFRVTNIRWDPIFRTRVTLYSYLSKFIYRDPKVSWEKIEREAISDEKPLNPTLQDLGVRLQYIEDLWPDMLSVWIHEGAYSGDTGEKKIYSNPPYILDH